MMISIHLENGRKRYEEVANMLRGCCEDVSDFQTISMWSGVSLTCRQQVVRVMLVEFGERHDKRTNGQRR